MKSLEICTAIKSQREKLGISIEQMAQVLRKNENTYYQFENGKLEMSISQLIKICEFLNLKVIFEKSPE